MMPYWKTKGNAVCACIMCVCVCVCERERERERFYVVMGEITEVYRLKLG